MNGNLQGGPNTIPAQDSIPVQKNEGTPSDFEREIERRRTIHRPRFSERVRSRLYRLIGLRTPAEKAADERHAQWRREEEESRAQERERYNRESETVIGKHFDARTKREALAEAQRFDDERRRKFNATSPIKEGEFFGAPIIQRSNTAQARLPRLELSKDEKDQLKGKNNRSDGARGILTTEPPMLTEEVFVDSVPDTLQDRVQHALRASLKPVDTQAQSQAIEEVIRSSQAIEKHSENVENIPERAKSARERIGRLLITMKEKYKELPPHKKLLVSGALIGAGLATSGGSGVLGAAVLAASATVKGLGSYVAGESVEEGLRKYLVKKNGGQELSKGKERFVQLAKFATIVTSFALAEWSDAKALFHDIEGAFSTPESAVTTSAPPLEADTTTMHDAQQELTDTFTAPAAPDTVTTSPPPTSEPVGGHTNFVGTHEVIVRAGDSLSKILLHGGINEMFTQEELAGLTWKAKQNLLENIANNLTPTQLREVGISSGNKNILKLGEVINVQRLAAVTKELTVLVGGERVPLLRRALDLSKMS
jgi:hypothetical protein